MIQSKALEVDSIDSILSHICILKVETERPARYLFRFFDDSSRMQSFVTDHAVVTMGRY